jgi:4-amino-4-deoxy-L-arabinose transferase-like glycosyltransferase
MNLFKSHNRVVIWLWIMIIVWIVMGRLSHQSLFGDGLLYASMSRNLADGLGDYWHLYFSDGYWLPDMPKYYYENPPLMIWIESFFFRALGDHWWTEKIFCLVLYLSNVLAFRYVWQGLNNHIPSLSKSWLYAVIAWIFIPVSIWATVNNMMDTMLLFWCLLAIGSLLRALKVESLKHAFIAGLFIFLGILTKGPVALYPLALPGVVWFIIRPISFNKSLYITFFSLLVSITGVIVLMYFSEGASEYFGRFWSQRLLAVITGSRADMALSGWSRVYIVYQYFLEGGLSLVLILLFMWKGSKQDTKEIQKWAFVFIGLSLCATLPIIASTKQSGIYLVPGLPMLSLGLGIVMDHQRFDWAKKTSEAIIKGLMVASAVGLIVFFNKVGKFGRDNELISSIKAIQSYVPPRTVLCVDSLTNEDFKIHGYVQRIGKYSLKPKSHVDCTYLLLQNDSLDIQKRFVGRVGLWALYTLK